MNARYAYSPLFFFFFFFLNFVTTENLPNVTIQHVCENEMLFLKCSNRNETIQIIRSMYGRTSQRICNQDLNARVWDKTCANIEQSKYQTKLRCHGKSTCQILISNHLFNDPCGLNVPKHFEIHYRCIYREKICSNLFLNCSKSKDLKCVEKVQEEFACRCPLTICQYVNQQLIGFLENSCPEEIRQGFHWPKTPINKGQVLSCPSPCIGEIFRSCDSNGQWSEANYTHCQCSIEVSDQLSTHRSANSYVFQCNFWLINRILPKENSCILSFANWEERNNGSLDCLVRAFQQMKFQSCGQMQSFGIEFKNLKFEIYMPVKNESRFDLFANEISVERTAIIKENFRANLPMMIIERKFIQPKNQSIILIEQENDFNSLQTANVTLVFDHRSSEIRYQCRAYHSIDVSFDLNPSNVFFACQLLCSNGSHVICQCPFFNPLMHYVLHIDRSTTENEVMVENDLNGRCGEGRNRSMEKDLQRIDGFVKEITSLTFAKKILLFIDRILGKEEIFSKWKIIKHLEDLGFRLSHLTNSFISMHNHIELVIKPNQEVLENHDRSVTIFFRKNTDENLLLFFTLSNLHTHPSFNSRVMGLNILLNNHSIDHLRIVFRHLNNTNQSPICVSLKNHVQWDSDGCQLLSTNFTHSICSCPYASAVALRMDFPTPIMQSNETRLLLISKIGCLISIICILFSILILILMRSNVNDDLTTVRNILHTNMLLCLIVVQALFVFGIDQTKYKISCRMISILLDYFLLAAFSWMFVDGIELLIALQDVFKIDRIRLLAYSFYSYGFPLLIVFLSITLSAKNVTGLSRYCWLSHDNAFIWAFAVPFTLLILGNLCFSLVSIYSICKNPNPRKQGTSLRDVSLISILFGLTWIIALFYLYDQTILFAYVFTVLNSFHGLLILIFYCLLQVNLRDLVGKLRLYKCNCLSFFDRLLPRNPNSNHVKSLDCFSLPDNNSSSGYSSGHSSDLNSKQAIDMHTKYGNHLSQPIPFHNHYDRRICSNNETCYLPSIPINLLANRLSTFRYQLPSNEIIRMEEQKEELLEKNPFQDDEHQYYEIG